MMPLGYMQPFQLCVAALPAFAQQILVREINKEESRVYSHHDSSTLRAHLFSNDWHKKDTIKRHLSGLWPHLTALPVRPGPVKHYDPTIQVGSSQSHEENSYSSFKTQHEDVLYEESPPGVVNVTRGPQVKVAVWFSSGVITISAKRLLLCGGVGIGTNWNKVLARFYQRALTHICLK